MSILDFPSSAVAGDTYRGYRFDGVKWNKIALSDPTIVYPSQSGNSGKFLTTNGVTVSWSTGTPGPQGAQGERGETGAQGVSVTLQGTKATIADLPAAPVDPQDYAGHGWIVTEGGGNLWFWNLTDEEWNNVGPIVGPQGDQGRQGDPGPQGDPGDAGAPGTTDFLQLSNRPQYLSEFINDLNKLVNGEFEVVLDSQGLIQLGGGNVIDTVTPNKFVLETGGDTDLEIFTIGSGFEPNTYSWKFGRDGITTFPGNLAGSVGADRLYLGGSDSEGTPSISIPSETAGETEYIWIQNQIGAGVRISTGGNNSWQFNDLGQIEFPDHTQQSTAWTGSTMSLSDTAPTDKEFWFNTVDNRLYINDGEVWVDASPNIVPETFSGDYDDLTNKPTIPSITADLTPTDVYWDSTDGRAYVKYNDQWVDIAPVVPVEVPTDINQLTDDDGLLNNIGGVTDYNDLDNLPTLFSGDYNDLTNQPNIPTDLNQLNNSSGFITGNSPSIVNPTITFDASLPASPPSFNTTSTGTRIKLWPQVSATEADYAIGISNYVLWNGIPQANSTYSFKWYAGTTNILTLRGDGLLTLGGTLKFADATEQTTAWTGSTDQIIKVAGSFASNQPFKSEVIADVSNGVTIKTWMGLPAFATSKTWEFDFDGNLTFPDATVQTTAYTGLQTTVTGNAGTATKLETARNINGVAFDGSAAITIKASTTNALTIGTGLSGTSFDGGSAVTIALASGYGDTQNPYASKTANYVLAAPNGSAGAPTFRAIVAADIPTLNQNTTGSAATLTTARNINGVSFNGSANINVPSITDGTNTLKIVAAPSSLQGAVGDAIGNVAFDTTYIYRCYAEYDNGARGTTLYAAASNTTSFAVSKGSYGTPTTSWTIQIANSPTYNINSVVDSGAYWTIVWSGGTATIGSGSAVTLTTPTPNANWTRTPWNAITSSVTTLSSLTSVGTLTSLAVTNSSSSPVTVTYTPGSTTGSALTLTGKDTIGGTGYFDFLKTTNTTSGATNPNKTFRMNSTGAVEIINSAYSATLFNLSDAGNLSISGDYQVNGKQAVNGPAFRAYVSVGQTITSGSQQTVTFGAETFDTHGCFTSNTFTPTVEGYYQLNATVRISGGSGTGEVMIVLYKNSSEYARGTNEGGTEQGASWYSMQVSDIAYANGSTDSFHIRIQQTSGSSKDTTAGSTISYFSGIMVRGA